jgi:hypothetical protein
VFDNNVPKRICGCKKEVTGCWRKLHNEVHHNLHYSSIIIRVGKSRKKAGHSACMGKKRQTKLQSENQKVRDSLGDTDIDGRTILKRTIESRV